MKVVLGIDPDNAWGLIAGEELMASGHCKKGLPTLDLLLYWEGVFRNLPLAPDLIIIEDQFFKMYGKEDQGAKIGMQKATMKLSKRAGMIIGVAFVILRQVAGEVSPGDWRRTSGLFQRLGRKVLKAAAKTLVWQLYQKKVTGDDEADAILIARHGSRAQL